MSPRVGLDINTILEAAAKIADKQGLHEVTLASLAKNLEVRTPSLYNHLHGLQGLKEKLSIYGLKELYKTLAPAAIGKSKNNALHSLADAYIAFARKHPGLYLATISAPDESNEELQQVGKEIIDIIFRVLRGYGLEGDNLVHAARGLRSILHGISSLEQSGGFGLPQNVDESLHLTIDLFIIGLSTMNVESES